MAWSAINASETDANSPLNQTLMDKIRENLDALHDGAGVTNAGLKTTTHEESLVITNTTPGYTLKYINFSDDYCFFPQMKVSATANANSSVLDISSWPAGGLSTSYQTLAYMYGNKTGGANFTMYVRWRYVQASRDEPVIWIAKYNGKIISMRFDPECSGKDHPFQWIGEKDKDGDKTKYDLNISCIQLNQNQKLKEYLWKNHHKSGGFLSQIEKIIKSEELVISEKTVKAKLSKLEAPCLHVKNIKLLDFTFSQKREV